MTSYVDALYNYKSSVFLPCRGVNYRSSEQKKGPTGSDTAMMDINEKNIQPALDDKKIDHNKRKIPTTYTHSRASSTHAMIDRFKPKSDDPESKDGDDDETNGKLPKKNKRNKIIFH